MRPRAAAVRRRRAPALLAVPALLTVGAVLLPLAYIVLRASGGGADAWRVLDPERTGDVLVSTVLLVVAVVGAAAAVGVPLAWLVTRTDLPGRRFWAVAAALPLVVPSYVAALALLGALGPRGLLQGALERPFGIERLPEIYGFGGAVLALTLSTYPYVYLLTATALRGLDPSLEEAARGLGQSPWRTFRRVTLPALRPSIGAGCLLVALYTLSDFGAVSLMQYPALTRTIYLQYQALFDRDPAAVLALVLVALTAIVLVLESRARRGLRYYRAVPGASRPPAAVALGRWRWAALGYCTAVVGLFLALPVGVLVHWAVQAVPLGDPVDVAWRAAANSVLASALAAG
ncbi:MAG: ABC transporter permease subunit, partial [Actinomycetota bacterium]|nr:ABC transporter permease subunit [Actinomycetota bacterium]